MDIEAMPKPDWREKMKAEYAEMVRTDVEHALAREAAEDEQRKEAALEVAETGAGELQDVLLENEYLRTDMESAFENGFECGLEDAELGMRYQYADEMNVYDQRLTDLKAQVEHIRLAVSAAQEGNTEAMQWLMDWASAEPAEMEIDLDIFEGDADE